MSKKKTMVPPVEALPPEVGGPIDIGRPAGAEEARAALALSVESRAEVPPDAPDASGLAPRRGRGRPPGKKNPGQSKQDLAFELAAVAAERDELRRQLDAKAEAENLEMVSDALRLSFRKFFARKAREQGKHWAVPEDELSDLVDVWAPVASRWLGPYAEKSPLASAAFVTYQVFKPRLAIDQAEPADGGPAAGA